jgi:NADH dehydrogenase
MADSGIDAVTGAFSYSGAVIAARLLGSGRRVRTLTGHPGQASTDTPIEVRALSFARPTELADSLRGVDTLYNTYWVRFARGHTDHQRAVANSQALFRAAGDAGVRRVVHISITHPSMESPFPYFRGKAQVEQALAGSGLPHAILRPAILFGGDGVLINNIAWLMRHLPVFAVGGDGNYRIRGVHVDDLARLCVEQAASGPNIVLDAVGPDRPTFSQLVQHIRRAVRSRCAVLHVPATTMPVLSGALGLVLRDKLLTWDEYRAMAAGLADTEGEPTGTTSLLEWIDQNAEILGQKYANEIDRHFRVAAPEANPTQRSGM